MAGEVEATEPDGDEAPPCVICHGAGFIRRQLPLTDPDFGKAWPCQCQEPIIAARRLERIFGQAEIPSKFRDHSFASFRLKPGADLAACDRVEEWAASGPESIYLYGDVGRMKTGLGYAAFRHRLETRMCDGLYRSAPDLLDVIRNTFDREVGGPRTSEVVEAARKVSLLFLDDLGAEQDTSWALEQFEKLLDYRYRNQLQTIITGNHDLGTLGKRLKAKDATSSRISSRISDMTGEGQYVVHVKGRDQRIRLGAVAQ